MSHPNPPDAPASAAVSEPSPAELARSLRVGWLGAEPATYHRTRAWFLRALGFIYGVAFLILHDQMLPLFGEYGLMPATSFVARLRKAAGFWDFPTLFWWGVSDGALSAWAWFGLGLSLLVICGAQNALVMALLWAVYLSFVHAGQTFYGYGWEILLLETGFLSIFLCPLRTLWPSPATPPPALPVLWMLRWLLFRLMLGAGLIKIRGDACWRDLTCLAYHYETQPVPHPLSWLLHQAPLGFHQLGVLVNHVVELVAPWFLFGPRRLRHAAAGSIVVFQLMLIFSGNLAFLNWLTIAVSIACFDDALLSRLLPARWAQRTLASASALPSASPTAAHQAVIWLLSATVVCLSYAPVMNMLSRHQRMNSSFDPLHLVNTYGAFGSVGKQRDEIILEGTWDARPGPGTRWQAYEFKCKPGDVRRRPCLITPYHYRLDWQMWFAALSDYEQEPWLVHLVYKLLRGDRAVASLLARNPFSSRPPTLIRAERYRYRFTRLADHSDAWWQRTRIGPYLPALSADNPSLRAFLVQRGFRLH